MPLVPMTYSSLLEAYGWERFASDARDAGAASLIVADLPVDAHPELRRVQLVAPTSTDERIALAAERPTAGSTSSPSPGRRARGPSCRLLSRRSSSGRARSRTSRSTRASASRPPRRPPRRRSSRTASSSALRRSSPPRTGGGARALRRSAARRARVATSQSRATCQASEPASMCSKWPVCGSTRSSHGSPAFRAAWRSSSRCASRRCRRGRRAGRAAGCRAGDARAVRRGRSARGSRRDRRAAPGSASTTA